MVDDEFVKEVLGGARGKLMAFYDSLMLWV